MPLPPPTSFGSGDGDGTPTPRRRRSVRVVALLVVVALVGAGAAALISAGANDNTSDVREESSTTTTETADKEESATTAEPSSGGVAPTGSPEQVAKAVGPSVVQLESNGEIGSGVIYDDAGLVLTAHHVVESGDTVNVVLNDGTKMSGRVVGRRPARDLAVVAIDTEKSLPAAKLGGENLAIGQPVVALGSPFGYQASVTSGIISGLNRQLTVGSLTLTGLIQTDAAINPGNSGGPLVDAKDRVIGINTAIASTSGGSNGVGFAIPIPDAKDLMDQVDKDGGSKAPTVAAPEGSLTNPGNGFQFQLPDSLGDLFGDLFNQIDPGQSAPNDGFGTPPGGAAEAGIIDVDPLPKGWTESNNMSFSSGDQGVETIILNGPSGTVTITATKGPEAGAAADAYSGKGVVRRLNDKLTVIVEGTPGVSQGDLKKIADAVKEKCGQLDARHLLGRQRGR